MRISFEKRPVKCCIGVLLAVLIVFSCWKTGGSGRACAILVMMLLAVTVFRLEIQDESRKRWIWALAFLAVPFATFLIGQIMQNVPVSTVGWRILLNAAIFLAIQLLVLLISGNLLVSLLMGMLLPLLFMLVNTYVCLFRGNALTPSDILSFRTAANVAAEYDFTPTSVMVYAFSLTAVVIMALFGLPKLSLRRGRGNSARILAGIIACGVVTLSGIPGVNVENWNNAGAMKNGYVLNFILQIKNVIIEKPENYSADDIRKMEASYTYEETPHTPDIIVIMDESFSNLNVFPNAPSTNVEVTPFMDSMRENVVRGYLYSSVFGGSTANSEYEFLTGNTMAFLPQGSIPYQQYISAEPYSLVSQLKGIGYHCVAMHPFQATGWKRNTVYPQLGFDEMYFLEGFPQKQMIREYVSDREMFEEIIRIHEQQDDTPLFLFGVTIQNHGGYFYEGADYEQIIELEGYSKEYPDAEQYLSVIHETDKAVQYLIEYYETVERDVVIAFFGDHLPKLNADFYGELNGGALDTLEEQVLKHKVPFFIWTNFDSEEQEVPMSSINYLSSYVLEVAGISLPPWQQFLKEAEAVIPVINALGYYSYEKQSFCQLDEAAGQEAEILRLYACLQYNQIFGEEERSAFFFGN